MDHYWWSRHSHRLDWSMRDADLHILAMRADQHGVASGQSESVTMGEPFNPATLPVTIGEPSNPAIIDNLRASNPAIIDNLRAFQSRSLTIGEPQQIRKSREKKALLVRNQGPEK